jgi:hypothetical protein
MNVKVAAMQIIAATKAQVVVSRTGWVVLLNSFKEFGILFGIFIILGFGFLFIRNEHISKVKWLVVLYVLAVCAPFIIFKTPFTSSMYLLPVLPVFAILGVYAIQLSYQYLKVKAIIKRIILVMFLVVAGYPMASKVSGEALASFSAKNDTRIEAKQWIEENIPRSYKLFYMGRYTYLPPIRARNRMAEDQRRDEKFNQSLKIHFDKFLADIANSDRYYIEDFTGRYWRQEEFEDVLNLGHLKENNIDYVVYCPDYFRRFEKRGFEKQKAVVDRMIDDVRSNSVLVKEFRAGNTIKNGPIIKIFKLNRS